MELLTEKYSELLESKKMPVIAERELSTTAVILENQAGEESKLIAEGTIASDVQQFIPIFMPLARRVMPTLIANELVGIQPLTTPTGFIYSINFRYTGSGSKSDINPTTAHDGSAVTSRVSPLKDSQILNVITTGTAVAVGDEVASVENAGTTGTVIYVEGTKALVKLTGTLADNVDTIAGGAYAPRFVSGDTLDADNTINGTWTNELSFRKVLKSYTGPVATSQAELLGYDMKEMGFSIVRKSIEAVSRKLKGEYSVEMYQDLKAMHGLNADEELMNMMALEVANEIDREIVDYVNDTATPLADANPFAHTAALGGARNDVDGYRNLAIKIANESREIARLTRRGAGNILLVAPKVATMLEQMKGYKASPVDTTVNAQQTGVAVIGTFEGKKVVVDNFAETDYCTVLYKGADRRDAIAYYAPYVPVSFTRITHEASGQPAIILNTRYGLTTNPLSPEAYARTFNVTMAGALA